jgi:hypothetical protein
MTLPDDTPHVDQPTLQPGIASGHGVQMGMPVSSLGMGGQLYQPVEPEHKKPSKVLIGIGIGGVVLAIFGAIRALVRDPQPAPDPGVKSVLSEQVDTGRNAIKIARDVQQTENQRIDSLQQGVQDAENLAAHDDDQ